MLGGTDPIIVQECELKHQEETGTASAKMIFTKKHKAPHSFWTFVPDYKQNLYLKSMVFLFASYRTRRPFCLSGCLLSHSSNSGNPLPKNEVILVVTVTNPRVWSPSIHRFNGPMDPVNFPHPDEAVAEEYGADRPEENTFYPKDHG